jgi:hypothetical protein
MLLLLFLADVSGKPIISLFKGEEIQEIKIPGLLVFHDL